MPSTFTSMFFAFLASSVCVAITCSTSLVPMPCAERAEGAVRGGVRVAADHRHARQRGAGLGADHVHDALALAQEREERGGAELGDVVVERGDLLLAGRVGNAFVAALPAGGRRVVVGRGHHRADAPQLAAGFAQPFEGLRAGDLVHQVAVDVEDRGAVFLGVDDVFVPDLVVERACHVGLFSFVGKWIVLGFRPRAGRRRLRPRWRRPRAGGSPACGPPPAAWRNRAPPAGSRARPRRRTAPR